MLINKIFGMLNPLLWAKNNYFFKLRYSKELFNCINAKDFESEKVNGFKNKFFDDLDGKSSKRVADLILKNLDI